MKKIVLFALVFIVQSIDAQTTKVISAYNYLNSGELDKAKTEIDAASLHDQTKESSKTWFYKGEIYYRLALSLNENYNSLDPHAFMVAADSYLRALSIDDRKTWNTKDAGRSLQILENTILNKATHYFNDQDYATSLKYFEKCIEISEYLGVGDELAYFNAGLTSKRLGDSNSAIKYYEKCITLNYQAESCYQFIAFIYQDNQQTEKYIETIDRGLIAFPESIDLLISKINYLLVTHAHEEALSFVERALAVEPNNATLHYVKGTLKMDLERYEEAEKAFKQALEHNNEYFDVYYNLGAFYFNQGVDLNNEAMNEADMDLGNEKAQKADELFKESILYLEKAHELNPTDQSTLLSLKTIYARLGMMDEFKEVNEKLKAL